MTPRAVQRALRDMRPADRIRFLVAELNKLGWTPPTRCDVVVEVLAGHPEGMRTRAIYDELEGRGDFGPGERSRSRYVMVHNILRRYPALFKRGNKVWRLTKSAQARSTNGVPVVARVSATRQ